MSSFTIRAVNKSTGLEHTVWCMDDHFGKHRYGYFVHDLPGCDEAMTEEDFYKQFKPKETKNV